MRPFLIISVIVAVVFGIVWLDNKFRVHYTEWGTVIDRITTQTREGHDIRSRIIVVRYNSGDVRELTVEARSFYNYEIGESYLFNRDSLKFN